MITFVTSLVLLFLGYFIYGSFVERVFGADANRPTPCMTHKDGVDYVEMPLWRVYLIQFLNIAGTGPIFGAIQGILFGPGAYIWIVIGCIVGGAVHDYLSGMVSLRKGGASLPEVVGDEVGTYARNVMRACSLILMILVGAAFTTAPAGLLAVMFGKFAGPETSLLSNSLFWLFVILAYYFIATLLPIGKVIGRIYPVFGVSMLIMALAVFCAIFVQPGSLPEVTETLSVVHPASTMPILPGLCITIACGAVSGFHATQSPLMARCMRNEKHGRAVFYGSMITEGVMAIIWCAAAIKFADALDLSTIHFAADYNVETSTPYGRLWAVMTNGGNASPNPAVVVHAICSSWLGVVGTILVILGVVAAPITTGDTAFRSARLIISDILKLPQKSLWMRILVALPVFAVSTLLMFVKFDVLWRYLFWFNQNLSFITLWALSAYLARKRKAYLVTMIPAMWMTWACVAYILVAPEGFQCSSLISNVIGIMFAMFFAITFLYWYYKQYLPKHQED